MAWVSTDEIQDGRSLAKDTSPVKKYVRSFNVTCEEGDDETTAENGTGVPALGDAHPRNSAAICQTVNVKQRESKDFHWVFRVTVGYSTPTTEPPTGGGDPNDPLNQLPVVTWNKEIFSTPMDRGFVFTDPAKRDTTEPILNSAQMRYDPPPLKDDRILVLTIQRNQSTHNAVDLFLNYENTVNRTEWYGFPAETVFFDGATATSAYDSGTATSYFTVTYLFKIRKDGWVTSVLDEGVYGFDDNGDRVRLKDDGGDAYAQPVPLDGNGKELAIDINANPPAVFEYRKWWTYPTSEFDEIGLTD